MRSYWLKQHTAGERSFARAMQRFFHEQAERLAAEISDIFPGPDAVAAIFEEQAEHEALEPILQRNVSRLALQGAADELRAIEAASERKSIDDAYYLAETQAFIETIPQAVRDRIRLSVTEAFEQPYWRDITSSIGKDLSSLIQQSHDNGDSNSRLAKKIREELGGTMARRRALRIARTETTNAMNSGHDASYQELEQSGLLKGKEWLAITDNDVRETHLANDGVIIRAADNFNVGDAVAPWPGHWSLPAAERILCRCTTIGVLS